MAEASLKLGTDWATKESSLLGYNDENGNYKPIPFDFSRASIGTRVNRNGLIEVVQDNIPRIDFTDANGALLLEPQRTNLITYSNDFTNGSWSKSAAGTGTIPILTSNYGISPDGLQNASRMQMNLNGGVSGGDISYLTYFLTSIAPATNSVYLKSLGSDATMTFRCGSTFKSILVTSGWQRFDVTSASGTDRLQLLLYGNSDSQSADLLIYGASLEQGSYPTSIINTSGSAVTRVADNAYQQSVTQVIGQSEGTMFIEFIPKDSSTLQILYQAKSSSGVVGQIDIRLLSGLIRALANDGGGSQFFINGGSYAVGTKYKVAIRYKLNDSKLYINGTDSGSDTSCSFTGSSLDQVSFADSLSSHLPSVDIIDSRLYNTALSDSELQALTQV